VIFALPLALACRYVLDRVMAFSIIGGARYSPPWRRPKRAEQLDIRNPLKVRGAV
jgi:hypothetical protein